MPDKYSRFLELFRAERTAAYSISQHDAGSRTIVVAPHGGGIEPGTSELARHIAGDDLSWYLFEGRKATHNRDLHITSANFDEPKCLKAIGAAQRVLTVHGEGSDADIVYVGGLHRPSIEGLRTSLAAAGFIVREHDDPGLQGRSAANICNRGQLGQGVQLELAEGLRHSFFAGFNRKGRQVTTERFDRFCAAVRAGLELAPV